jgi:ribosomal protein L34E
MADTTEETTNESEAMVPSARLRQETEKRKEAEKRERELEARLQALEDQGKPEMERLAKEHERAIKRAEEAEQRAQEIERKAVISERRSLVTDAASKLKFRNPADASLFVNLDEIEDAASAERALKGVVKERDYLIASDTRDPKGLERVLGAGSRNGQAAGEDGRPLTEDEFIASKQSEAVLNALEKAGIPFAGNQQQ